MCPKVKDIGGSEMSENIPLKMGAKFALTLNIDQNLYKYCIYKGSEKMSCNEHKLYQMIKS